jgi:hypothetical protein
MVPEGSLPCSQQPAAGISHEPDESSPHSPTRIYKIHFNINPSRTPRTSSGLSTSDFSTKTLLIFLICVLHARIILLDVIILVIFDKKCKL